MRQHIEIGTLGFIIKHDQTPNAGPILAYAKWSNLPHGYSYLCGLEPANYPMPAIDVYQGFNAFEWHCVPSGFFTLRDGTSWRRK